LVTISAPVLNPGDYNEYVPIGTLPGYGLDDVTSVHLWSTDGGPASVTLTPETTTVYPTTYPPAGKFQAGLFQDTNGDNYLPQLWFTLPLDDQAPQVNFNYTYSYMVTVTSPEGTSAPVAMTFG
jgi:hypothetical protein